MAKNFSDVAAEIRRRIESGQFPPDRPLPSERTLGETFGVHRATLRRALVRLEADGLLRRSHGERPYPNPVNRPVEGIIGLCATDHDDPFARSLIANGILEILRERGSRLQLTWIDDHTLSPDVPFSSKLDSLAGLFLWPPFLTDVARLKELRKRMPTVILDAPVGGYESDFVGFEDEEAGYEATKHLVENGHQRIAFVGTLHVVTARYRYLGFQRCMQEAGIDPIRGHEPLVYVDRVPMSVVDGYFNRPLGERPTAYVCENDESAARLMPYLIERGLRIPQDIALVGFGGAQPVLLSALGLTTMEQPYVQVGREAARLMLGRLDGQIDGPPEQVLLPMTLKVRSSSRGPAQLVAASSVTSR